MRELCSALAADALIVPAQSLDEAERQLQEAPPDAVVVAYHFDELRPFRLIRHVREQRECADLPILLVRVLHVPTGTTEEEIRRGYQNFGANDFFDFHAHAQRHGQDAALEKLCACMRVMLRAHLLAPK